MKRLLVIFGMASLCILLPSPLLADRQGFVNKVVIDPGHGGDQPGAVGRRSKEKDLALAISIKLGDYIRQNMDDVEVIFTRETDVAVSLAERARIANEHQADLFISVHCNSVASTSALGTETFVMGLHRTQANLEVARRENKAILYEDDYLETYDGFDPNSPEATIILGLYQQPYLEQSLRMAALVQEQFRERARRVDRGVKQAGFMVLYRATMPGILVEAGFLSNPREEAYLMSEEGQSHIASAIYRAFRQYKEEQDAIAAAGQRLTSVNGHLSANIGADFAEIQQAIDPQNQVIIPDSIQTNQESAVNSASISQDDGPVLSFRVQFTSTAEEKSSDDPIFNGLPDVSSYFYQGLFRYTVGNYNTMEEASIRQTEIRRQGFQDAFVVIFNGKDRISFEEAARILNQQTSNH